MGGSIGWEGEDRVRWGGENISYRLPLGGLDMCKQQGGESRCLGIQESLHMHVYQTSTASVGWRKNKAPVGWQAADIKNLRGGKSRPF